VERAAGAADGPQASEYRTCARKGGADQRADLDRGPQAAAAAGSGTAVSATQL